MDRPGCCKDIFSVKVDDLCWMNEVFYKDQCDQFGFISHLGPEHSDKLEYSKVTTDDLVCACVCASHAFDAVCSDKSALHAALRYFRVFPPILSSTMIPSIHSFSPSPLLVACCVCISRAYDERVVLLLMVRVSVSLSLYSPPNFSQQWQIN